MNPILKTLLKFCNHQKYFQKACGRSGVQIPGRPNLTQRCKRFANASTSTQVGCCVALSRRWVP